MYPYFLLHKVRVRVRVYTLSCLTKREEQHFELFPLRWCAYKVRVRVRVITSNQTAAAEVKKEH